MEIRDRNWCQNDRLDTCYRIRMTSLKEANKYLNGMKHEIERTSSWEGKGWSLLLKGEKSVRVNAVKEILTRDESEGAKMESRGWERVDFSVGMQWNGRTTRWRRWIQGTKEGRRRNEESWSETRLITHSKKRRLMDRQRMNGRHSS